MRKMKICMWTGTRRRSSSRLSRVVGLAGESGCTYSKGLPAAPLMGFRRVALKKTKNKEDVSRSSYNSLLLIIMLAVCVSTPHLLFLYISSNSVTSNSHSTIDHSHTAAILESSNVILLCFSFSIKNKELETLFTDWLIVKIQRKIQLHFQVKQHI